jgi:hypothetical protein
MNSNLETAVAQEIKDTPDWSELSNHERERVIERFTRGFIAGQKAMRVELPRGFFKSTLPIKALDTAKR